MCGGWCVCFFFNFKLKLWHVCFMDVGWVTLHICSCVGTDPKLFLRKSLTMGILKITFVKRIERSLTEAGVLIRLLKFQKGVFLLSLASVII